MTSKTNWRSATESGARIHSPGVGDRMYQLPGPEPVAIEMWVSEFEGNTTKKWRHCHNFHAVRQSSEPIQVRDMQTSRTSAGMYIMSPSLTRLMGY